MTEMNSGPEFSGLSLEAFTRGVAARTPTPGGGGVSALAGALAVSLAMMCGGFTRGKSGDAGREADIDRMLDEGERLRAALIALIDADAAAFAPVARAYALPKGDPDRRLAIARATAGAAEAPLEMIRSLVRVVLLLEEMGEKGSRMLLSDIACGGHLAAAALRSASVNVFVNTAALADRDLASALEAEADGCVAEYAPRAERLAAELTDRIRGRRAHG